MNVNFYRTFVIQPRKQILDAFDVDRSGQFFLSSIEGTSLFIRQTQPFLRCFNEQNTFENFRVVSHWHQKLRPRRREVLILMHMKPQGHSLQQAEPAEYSKYCRRSRYTLWKTRLARFCLLSKRAG